MKRPIRSNYPNLIYGDNDFVRQLEKYCSYLENRLDEKEKERGIAIIGPKSDTRLTEHLQRLVQTDKKVVLIGAFDFGQTTLSEQSPFPNYDQIREMRGKMLKITKIDKEYFGEKSQSKYHK